MPTYVIGDLWQARCTHGATVIGVTTNAVISRRGNLVMGAGVAEYAARRWEWLPAWAGDVVCQRSGIPTGKRQKHQIAPSYGWIVTPFLTEGVRIGLFQTKENYRYHSTPELIARSAACLAAWLAAQPNDVVALPMPGVGYGGLQRDAVLPVLADLPERVLIFEREWERKSK